MMSRGWRNASKTQVKNYLSLGNTTHQFHIAKLHPYIVPWSELGDRSHNFNIKEYLDRVNSKLVVLLNNYIKKYLEYADSREDQMIVRKDSSYKKLHRIGKNYTEWCDLFKNSYLKDECAERYKEIIKDNVVKKMFSILVDLDKEMYRLGMVAINYIEGTGENNELIKESIKGFKQSCERKNSDLENYIKMLNENQRMLVEDYLGLTFMRYLYFRGGRKELKKVVDELLVEIEKQLNDNSGYGSTGVQSWIDQFMYDFQLKISDTSIRENNRKTIQAELKIMKAYSEKLKSADKKSYEQFW